MSEEKTYKRFWSIPEICNLYNMRESWLRRQIFLKKVPYIKMGRLIRFDIHDLENWIVSVKTKSSPWDR